MDFTQAAGYLWVSLVILVLGSIYLIIEGYHANKLFGGSIVGKLLNTLVVILLIQLYSLAVVCYDFLNFYPQGAFALLPIVLLWLVSLAIAVVAIRMAKKEVSQMLHK